MKVRFYDPDDGGPTRINIKADQYSEVDREKNADDETCYPAEWGAFSAPATEKQTRRRRAKAKEAE